jgi:phosphomevalonate kinase
LAYAFAGQSASTERLIGKAEEAFDVDARLRFVARSDALGDSLESALQRGSFPEVREVVEELHALLCTLGPLETEGIRQIVALARTLGSVAKISGAGGGDGCVLFSPDAGAQANLLEGLHRRGILTLPLTAEPGLRGEADAEPRLTRWLS